MMPEPTPLGLAYNTKATDEVNGKVAEAKGVLQLPKMWTATELLNAEFPEPRWAVPGLLGDGLYILAGRPKLGKSWLCLGFCAGIARGGYVLGNVKVEKGRAIYLALEDKPRRLKKRLALLGLDKVKDDQFNAFTEWKRMGKGGLKMLVHLLDQYPETRLVVIDTLARIKRDSTGNRSMYDEDSRMGEELKKVADHFGVCILIVHHIRKMGADDPLEKVSGTFGLTGAADGILVLSRERGKHDATLFVTGRDIQEEREMALKWDHHTANWVLIGDAEQYRMSEERRAILNVLKASKQALTPKDVAGILQRPVAPVKQLLWLMAQDGQIKAVGDGRYMEIPTASFTSFTGPSAGTEGQPGVGQTTSQPVNGAPFTAFTAFTAPAEAVNAVKGVKAVNAVKGVKAKREDRGIACLSCGRDMPEGWYFRCPECLEKLEAQLYADAGE